MQTEHATADDLTRQRIVSGVTETIVQLVQDWDLPAPIDVGTYLVADLGFESIDLIQMASALGQQFGHSTVSFAELLIRDGRYVDDLTVGQVADFLAARI